jgi:hypothetical protein
MNHFVRVLLFLKIFLLFSCKGLVSEKDLVSEKSLFRLLSADFSGVNFNNAVVENDTFNMVDYFYVYNGGGVALGDINNDSLLDIYFTGNMVNDRLYINKGNLQFEDISESAGILFHGWSTGVTMVDINNDGFLDIYVCRSGNYTPEERKNLLFVNNGDMTFTERAQDFGIADQSFSTQAAFFDYDKDGDLDLYLLNHTNEVRNPNQVRPLVTDGSGLSNDRLYENNGDGIFKDVTLKAGILYDGLGLGVGIVDINNDGWEDILISNDFIAHDYLYINNGDGTFQEKIKEYFKHLSHFSMGNDIADFNNDGWTDVITVDMLPAENYHQKKMSGPMNYNLFKSTLEKGYMPQYMRNTLQLNQGIVQGDKPSFAEIGQLLNIHATDWSWGPLFADFNNDGWKDLLITNGYLRDITDLDFINYTAELSGNAKPDSLDEIIKQKALEMPSIKVPNVIFKNKQALNFENVTDKWGLSQPSLSNGASYGDLDNDGDLDIVINNINDLAFVYENHANKITQHNFLQILLAGDQKNPSAIGAEVRIYHNGVKQVKRQAVTRGYQSSVDYKIHFGLGKNQEVDSLLVLWNDGKITKRYKPGLNQTLRINKREAESLPNINDHEKPLFLESTQKYNLSYFHKDKSYNDFSRQFLLPHKHSQQGPGIAVGDINGDGLDDFFVGGSYNYSGRLFYQMNDSKFRIVPLIDHDDKQKSEDTGVLFFDYDNDQDLDLYIVSGSNEFYLNSKNYQDRLYKNDGHGNLELDNTALPDIRFSGSCVKAADFDQDGDLDLFVGGRLVPLEYPLPADSYLLINENGKFINQTAALAPGLQRVGMVKDALWTDFDNDGDTDLIVVGEFIPVQFFENKNGRLENISEKVGLKYTAGWWNSINGADFDNDGDIDYIIGNMGLNSKYKASPKEPVTIYANDYDRNGSIDPIITYFSNHKEYPVHTRDDLIKQIPAMKKKFPNYASYAKADISMVLTPEAKSRSYIAKAFQFNSIYLENKGEGKFQSHPLPIEAQFAPVYGILILDFDHDGYLDILLTGNDYTTEVITGRYDASIGLLLSGDGKGHFKPINPAKSNLLVDGDSRGAATIKVNKNLVHLFAQNSGKLKAYERIEKNEEKRKILNIPANALKARILLFDGTEHFHEFYYGASYLSQSTRFLELNGNEKQVLIYDYKGGVTEINIGNIKLRNSQ